MSNLFSFSLWITEEGVSTSQLREEDHRMYVFFSQIFMDGYCFVIIATTDTFYWRVVVVMHRQDLVIIVTPCLVKVECLPAKMTVATSTSMRDGTLLCFRQYICGLWCHICRYNEYKTISSSGPASVLPNSYRSRDRRDPRNGYGTQTHARENVERFRSEKSSHSVPDPSSNMSKYGFVNPCTFSHLFDGRQRNGRQFLFCCIDR